MIQDQVYYVFRILIDINFKIFRDLKCQLIKVFNFVYNFVFLFIYYLLLCVQYFIFATI